MSSLGNGKVPTHEEILVYARLKLYRSVLNRIHEGGNIYYDKDRMAAYIIVAKMASNERRTLQ